MIANNVSLWKIGLWPGKLRSCIHLNGWNCTPARPSCASPCYTWNLNHSKYSKWLGKHIGTWWLVILVWDLILVCNSAVGFRWFDRNIWANLINIVEHIHFLSLPKESKNCKTNQTRIILCFVYIQTLGRLQMSRRPPLATEGVPSSGPKVARIGTAMSCNSA